MFQCPERLNIFRFYTEAASNSPGMIIYTEASNSPGMMIYTEASNLSGMMI